jgi:hypothetical protein
MTEPLKKNMFLKTNIPSLSSFSCIIIIIIIWKNYSLAPKRLAVLQVAPQTTNAWTLASQIIKTFQKE